MRSKSEQQDPGEPSSSRDLRILTEVEGRPDITQRQLAGQLGIALGLTNVLLRRLVQKGFVRITQSGWRRRLYTLTPEGFSQKLRLMVAYIHQFLDQYQTVRQTLRDQLAPLSLNVESRVALCGTGEFAELVYLGLKEIGIEEIDVFSSGDTPVAKFLGIPVHDIETLNADQYDRVMIAQLGTLEASDLAGWKSKVEPDKLVTFFTNIDA